MLEADPIEEWRPVIGYEGWYSVSSIGRVRRERMGPNTYVGKILTPHGNCHGYYAVTLSCGKHTRTQKVHRLVAAAFLNPSLFNETVNHMNGVKTDNRVENLEYMTSEDNYRHGVDVLKISTRNKGVYSGEANHEAILSLAQVQTIRRRHREGQIGYRRLAKEYGVGRSTIKDIIKRRSWALW